MSVHGYQLVHGLQQRGHQILSCLGEHNPGTINFSRTKMGACRLALQADVLYIRVSNFSFLERSTLLKLLRPFSLPVVWEVNAPVEELSASMPPGPDRDAILRHENRRRKMFARLADAGIGVSEVLRQYIQDFLGIRKAYCIPNGSDPKLFAPESARETALTHLRDKFKVCWMGNARTPWQGIEIVLEAARRMQALDPEVLFVILTGDSIWNFPLLPNLLVLRQVPYLDFPHYLAAADVCLCLYEKYDWIEYGFYGSSLKLFDYMAAAKPVIASNLGQIATVIKDGVNGLLVEDDVDRIISLIRDLKANPEKCSALGARAREDVINHYTWDHVVAKTEAVLKEVGNL